MTGTWEELIKLLLDEKKKIAILKSTIEASEEKLDPIIDKLYHRFITNSSGTMKFLEKVGEFVVFVDAKSSKTVKMENDVDAIHIGQREYNIENKINDKAVLNSFKKWINSDSVELQAYFKTPFVTLKPSTIDHIKDKINAKLLELSTPEAIADATKMAPKAASYVVSLKKPTLQKECVKFNERIDTLLKEFVKTDNKVDTNVHYVISTLELLESSLEIQTIMMDFIMNS